MLSSGPQLLADVSRESQSLVRVIRDFRPEKDRLLSLTGDHWTALRSQQYLLVHPAEKPELVESQDTAGVRRLYLKPDDFWNVHDVSIAYEAIADEMEQSGL